MKKLQTERATLGGGCFWCLEAAFDQLSGVVEVVSGYAGGRRPNPTYEQVCAGVTGHAEVVQIHFDPATLPFRKLLQIFFTIHDPTTKDRQGADVGTQYRSIILYHSPEQKNAAEEVIAEMERENLWPDPVVTEVVSLGDFYPAEAYHKDYYQKNPTQPYCQAVVAPKVAKVRQQFLSDLKK